MVKIQLCNHLFSEACELPTLFPILCAGEVIINNCKSDTIILLAARPKFKLLTKLYLMVQTYITIIVPLNRARYALRCYCTARLIHNIR